MKSISLLIAWISDKLRVLAAICLVGMTLLTCVDVVGRFFRHPVFGSVELVGFMATLTVAMALPYTHQLKGHIGVEILMRLLPEKVQYTIDICTGILSLGLVALITWRMSLYAGTIRRSGEVSMNLELPIHYVIYAVSFCFLVFALVVIQDVVNDIKRLKK